MRISVKQIIGFSLLTLIFSVSLLLGEVLLLSASGNEDESFIEISVYEKPEEKEFNYIDLAKEILEKKSEEEKEEMRKNLIREKLERLSETASKEEKKQLEEELLGAPEVIFDFTPESFIFSQNNGKKVFGDILDVEDFHKFLKKLTISVYRERDDVRGKMKNKTVKIFGPQRMEEDELIAIFIHELSHYIDLYFLERKGGEDISNDFYDISWYSTVVMKPGGEGKDFVSGYAMTNKYEDFAESLTYYIFHNKDFLEKVGKSEALGRKYNFISENIFPTSSFQNTDFSSGNKVKDYYRDITKIDFSRNNFLQYVKNSI